MDEHGFSDPHDRFFRFSFSEIEVPRALLAEHLPREVVQCLNLESLRLVDGSFVYEELRRSQSDLLFECELKRTGLGKPQAVLVHLLFEHKSYADRLMPFQLLKYMVRIQERRVREGLPLCCVIPVVVYHGVQPWSVARSLEELIDVPTPLQSFVPRFSIPLFDLSTIPDARLSGEAFSRAALLLLKYARRPDLVRLLGLILETLRPSFLDEGDQTRLHAFLVYVASAAPQLGQQQLAGILESTFLKQGEALMATIAEQWMNQGMEKGLEKGLEKGRKEGRKEGREEGREEGRLIGTIQMCSEILGEPVDEAVHRGTSIEALRHLAAEFQDRVRARLSGR